MNVGDLVRVLTPIGWAQLPGIVLGSEIMDEDHPDYAPSVVYYILYDRRVIWRYTSNVELIQCA